MSRQISSLMDSQPFNFMSSRRHRLTRICTGLLYMTVSNKFTFLFSKYIMFDYSQLLPTHFPYHHAPNYLLVFPVKYMSLRFIFIFLTRMLTAQYMQQSQPLFKFGHPLYIPRPPSLYSYFPQLKANTHLGQLVFHSSPVLESQYQLFLSWSQLVLLRSIRTFIDTFDKL